MYKSRCLFVILFVAIGCGSKPEPAPSPTIEQQIAAVPGIDLITNFIDEKDPWTKYYKSWDFVKTRARFYDANGYDPPIFFELKMASVATDWSKARALQKGNDPIQENKYAPKFHQELSAFVSSSMPWAPVKMRDWMMSESVFEDGESGMLEWKWVDLSYNGTKKLELWFRMKTRNSFIAE